jgi:hypothetical protein
MTRFTGKSHISDIGVFQQNRPKPDLRNASDCCDVGRQTGHWCRAQHFHTKAVAEIADGFDFLGFDGRFRDFGAF